MVLSLSEYIKKILVPVAVGVSAWLITEIPQVIGFIPATVDGYSTAGVVGALGFILSGAVWVHKELIPMQNLPAQTATTTIQSSAADKAASATSPAPFVLSATPASTAATGTVTFTVSGNKGAWTLYDQTNTPVTKAINVQSISYTLTDANPIGIVTAQDGKDILYAMDSEGNKTNTVTLTLS